MAKNQLDPFDVRLLNELTADARTPLVQLSKSAFSEIIVVKVPAPATKGKAIGTILPSPPSSW